MLAEMISSYIEMNYLAFVRCDLSLVHLFFLSYGILQRVKTKPEYSKALWVSMVLIQVH